MRALSYDANDIIILVRQLLKVQTSKKMKSSLSNLVSLAGLLWFAGSVDATKCRCLKPGETFYSRRLEERDLQYYYYSVTTDDQGYYIVDGVRVIPDDVAPCDSRRRLSTTFSYEDPMGEEDADVEEFDETLNAQNQRMNVQRETKSGGKKSSGKWI